MTIRNGRRPTDMQGLVAIELTARGMTQDKSPDEMWKWFAKGRQWIVQGFTDLTNQSLQKSVWRRRQ